VLTGVPVAEGVGEGEGEGEGELSAELLVVFADLTVAGLHGFGPA